VTNHRQCTPKESKDVLKDFKDFNLMLYFTQNNPKKSLLLWLVSVIFLTPYQLAGRNTI